MDYPETRRQPVVQAVHGVEITDPYRWLEEGDAPAVKEWTDAQNRLTAETLAAVPGRDAIHARLAELLSIGTLTTPAPRGGRYFYQRRVGAQDQPVLLWRQGLRGEDRPLIDPAVYEADGAAALDWWYPSPDGWLVAYGISRGGDERSTLRVRVVDTGEDLADTIPHTRYSSLAWLPDRSGFYYTRYPEPGSVPEGEENYWKRVYFHRLGDDRRDDPLIFGEARAREDMYGVDLSPNGRWLVVAAWQGWSRSELYLLDRQNPGAAFTPIVEGVEALFIAEVQNHAIYVQTNHEAPNYRVFRIDPDRPSREAWREIIPESEGVLQEVAVVGGHLVCHFLRRAASELKIYSLDGVPVRDVELPGFGSLSGFRGEWDRDELFYGYVSFAHPKAVYHHEVSSGETALWDRVETPVDPDRFVARQVRYPSRDGTPISMFLVHQKGLELDGQRPTLLTGYGGFNVSRTPGFLGGTCVLLERGGVYAVANLRGGGEYGEAWHQAGMRERKQNVFDDCIAAAEWLIGEGYTRPEKLAVQGGSNGGLLVGAVVTQRPELFRAAVCAVPLLDMVRYHRFLLARLWIAEYGSSEDPEQFRYLHAYSPYHHVREGERYPAMLLTAAESDTRVDPLHARKFAALLQHANGADTPVLLRVEGRAGHGAGKPLSKVVEEAADVWSFLFWQLGLEA